MEGWVRRRLQEEDWSSLVQWLQGKGLEVKKYSTKNRWTQTQATIKNDWGNAFLYSVTNLIFKT